ncbi:MAG: GntR family transcriptional regulator [Caulobacteraceae bacterium]|nr:GntR family transcriptional regulator [Caulobacteraceae bacterium]
MAIAGPTKPHARLKQKAPRTPKLGEQVARRIIAEIRSRGWPVGELIGTEAELTVRFGVSRATLLEAVRQLERHGAAVMRRGGKGGLVVSNPESRSIARVLSSYIELSDIPVAEQFEAAWILESRAAQWAAESAHEDAIAKLRKLADEALGAESYLALSGAGLRLSNAMAEAAGNPALSLFIRAVVRARSDFFQKENRRDRPISRPLRDYAEGLGRLVEAIASGDGPEAGRQLALQHERVDRFNVDRFSRLSAGGSPLVAAAKRRNQGDELSRSAEVLAFRIRDEIIARDWPLGERLGEEPELLERFEISRWVFRQAVRLLELHGIVEMRRGQRGGMVIGRPDPSYAVETTVSYFAFSGLPRATARAVWTALLAASVQLAASRLPAAQDAAAAREAFAGPPDVFYNSVFRATENRVLDLYGRILTAYVLENEADWAGDDEAGRREILEALLAADAALARRRMQRHLAKAYG